MSSVILERVQSRTPAIEPTLPLINVVFLLLIFFLAVGSLRTPTENTISPPKQVIKFDETEFSPTDWVYLSKTGDLRFQKANLEITDIQRTLIDGKGVLFADTQTSGKIITNILLSYQNEGASDVMIITEQDANSVAGPVQ